MVEGGLRRARARDAAQPLHRRHRRRRDAHVAALGRRRSTSSRRTWCAPSSSAWAPTARSAPTRTRSRSSARRPTGYAQGYFVYDSKKSGAMTVSHLRFGPRPDPLRLPDPPGELRRPATSSSSSTATTCSSTPRPGAAFLLNAPYGPDEVWDHLPREVQEQIVEKRLRFFVIDAYRIAREAGMKGRINTIMQTCFFAISGVLPRERRDRADQEGDREDLRQEGRRGRPSATSRRWTRRSPALAEVAVPSAVDGDARAGPPVVPAEAPDFVKRVTAVMIAGQGRPAAGLAPSRSTAPGRRARRSGRSATSPPRSRSGTRRSASSATSARSSARTPRSAPRSTSPTLLDGAPADLQVRPLPRRRVRGLALHDPGRARGLHRLHALRRWSARPRTRRTRSTRRSTWRRSAPLREAERENYAFFLDLPEPDRTRIRVMDVKGSQFLEPLFEYSGACAGCGETPYIKLLTQLFGDRLLIANATGCSLDLRRQPADDALHRQPRRARPGLVELALRGQRGVRPRHAPGARQPDGPGADCSSRLSPRRSARRLVGELLEADQSTEAGIAAQRERVAALAERVSPRTPARGATSSTLLADYLVRKSVWIVGGDGWAYDIGYGGLDHVLSLPSRRQHPRARHRGLLEHRRPAVEGDAARRRREVRRRQARRPARRTWASWR